MVNTRNVQVFTVLVKKPEGRWPLGRPRYRPIQECNINVDLKETGVRM
jgi:hypothetical protein